MNGTVDRSAQASRSLEIFAFLWACTSIFHQAKGEIWAVQGIDLLMIIAAASVLVRPSNLTNFLILAVVQLIDLYIKLPNITNHTVVMGVTDLAIIAAVVREAWRRPGAPLDKGSLFETFAPAVRLETLVLYFYVVFHKLNWDFLDPQYSAASVHYQNLLNTLAKLHLPQFSSERWAQLLAIYGTLVIETAIPILISIRPTRIIGVWMGLLFHFVLGFEDYYDFTTMMFALLFLFTPENFPSLLADWWKDSRIGGAARRIGEQPIFRTIPPAIWIAAVGALVIGSVDVLIPRNSFRLFKVLWMFYAAAVMTAFAGAVHGRRRSEPIAARTSIFHLPSPIFAIFPLLVLLNGASPYLGLKTRSCFTMFSNLRTEGGTSNHLIVPASTQIAGFQKEMVLILESSDPILAKLADKQTSIPLFNLRTMISAKASQGQSGTSIKYTQGDRTIIVADAEKDPVLSKPYPYLLRKFLLFGGTNPGPHQVNRH